MTKKYLIPSALLALLSSCGNTQLEHCENEFDPVEKGNVDSLNAQKGEVISTIPEGGSAETMMQEAAAYREENTDSISSTPLPSDIDESGEAVAAEEGAEISISEKVEREQLEETDRRASEEAQRQSKERERKALEEMGN